MRIHVCAEMQKLTFIIFVCLGALIGFISAAEDGWGTRIVMMAVGVLFGAPVGAALAKFGQKRRASLQWEDESCAAAAISPRSLATNYWRDKGHPPFAKPPEAEPDKHMFEPDKLA